MARQGEIQLVITAVSDVARKELDTLSKQYNKLVAEQSELTEGTQAFANKSKEIDKVRERMAALAKQIEDGTLTSYDRLAKAEKAAERELRGLIEGTEQYIKTAKRLEAIRGEKMQLKESIAGVGKEMAKAESGFSQFTASMKENLTGLLPLGAAAAGAFAVDKLLQYGQEAVAAFNEAENSAFDFHQQMVVLGGESEDTFMRLMDQADALEKTTFGFSAEQIQAAQTQLKIFGLTGDEIERLTPKILDYAAATGKDLASAADDVSNALLGKDKALQKVGIRLEDSQLTVQGITDSLDKFAGTAAARLDVGTNALERITDKLGEWQEMVGGFLVQVGAQFLDWLRPVGEGLAGLWGVFSRVAEAVSAVIRPIAAWVARMAESYPIIGRVVEVVKTLINPFGLLGSVLKNLATSFQVMVAGAIAGVKTVREIWGNLAAYGADVFGGIGRIIKTALTDPFNIGTALAGFKDVLAKQGGEIANTFVSAYNAEMAKFQELPQAATAANDAAVKDRKIKGETEAKEKVEKEKDTQAKITAEQDKAEKERQRLRDLYDRRVMEGNRMVRDAELAYMAESYAKEKALIEDKTAQELAKIALLEQELTANTAISEEERAALMQTYSDLRVRAKEQETAQLSQLDYDYKQKSIELFTQAELAKIAAAQESEKKQADIARQAAEKAAERQDIANRNRLAVLDTEIVLWQGNSDRVLQLLKERAAAERDIALQNAELTAAERLLVEEEYQARVRELDQQGAEARKAIQQEVVDATIGIFQSGFSAMQQFSAMTAETEMKDADLVRDYKIRALEREKERGLLTEQQYETKKNAIEAQSARTTARIKGEQARRDKAIALVQAAINTAVAVTAGMASPAIPPFPSAIAAGIAGALQIALIAAKPIPAFARGGLFAPYVHNPRYEVGGIARGASHAQGGIALVDSGSGRKVGEMEGGEPYLILSRNTYGNNRQLIDRLLYNSMYRNGAPVFEAGGILATSPITSITAPSSTGNRAADAASDSLISEIRALRAEFASMKRQLRAYVVFSDIEDAQNTIGEIRERAGG